MIFIWRIALFLFTTLLTQQAHGLSEQLTNFMKTSGLQFYCEDKKLSQDECVILLKKVCGILDVSDPTEDEELKACLNRERCGDSLVSVNATRVRRQTPTDKWLKKSLKYYVHNTPTTTTLTKADIEKMTRLALGVWACYAQLDFSPAQTPEETDFMITFGGNDHIYFDYYKKTFSTSDDKYPFDGSGGTLAHCFYPQRSYYDGNLHMDDSESWSANLDASGAVNTFNVLVHELGHGLGLMHAKEYDNIMAPFYVAILESTLDLGPWEKWAIQHLYGERTCTNKEWITEFKKWFPSQAKVEEPEEELPYADDERCAAYTTALCHQPWLQIFCKKMCGLETRVVRNVKSKNLAEVCNKQALHGIFDFVDGYTYIISNGQLYRRDPKIKQVDPEFRKEIGALWKGAPANPTAAVYSRAAESLFLFEGKDIFVVSGLHGDILKKGARVSRVTSKDPKYPESPNAAFIKFDDRESGNIHLVKGHDVFVINAKDRTILKSFQFRKLFEVGKYGKRIPRAIDGAFHSFKDDNLYFITGSSYTLAIPDRKTGLYTIPSGTQPFSTAFLRCPQQ